MPHQCRHRGIQLNRKKLQYTDLTFSEKGCCLYFSLQLQVPGSQHFFVGMLQLVSSNSTMQRAVGGEKNEPRTCTTGA